MALPLATACNLNAKCRHEGGGARRELLLESGNAVGQGELAWPAHSKRCCHCRVDFPMMQSPLHCSGAKVALKQKPLLCALLNLHFGVSSHDSECPNTSKSTRIQKCDAMVTETQLLFFSARLLFWVAPLAQPALQHSHRVRNP